MQKGPSVTILSERKEVIDLCASYGKNRKSLVLELWQNLKELLKVVQKTREHWNSLLMDFMVPPSLGSFKKRFDVQEWIRAGCLGPGWGGKISVPSQGPFPLCLLGFVNSSIYNIHWTHLLRHTRDSDSGLETKPYSKSHRKSFMFRHFRLQPTLMHWRWFHKSKWGWRNFLS